MSATAERIDVLNEDRTVYLQNVPLSELDFSDPDDFEAAKRDIAAGNEHQVGGSWPLFILRPAVAA